VKSGVLLLIVSLGILGHPLSFANLNSCLDREWQVHPGASVGAALVIFAITPLFYCRHVECDAC